MKAFVIFPLVFSCYFIVILGDEDVRCTDTRCKDASCSDVPTKCKSNATNAGTYMLSPDICNCCDYCLANLEENEECSVGDPSNSKHTTICGPGLTCQTEEGETDGTCQRLSSPCMDSQLDFDIRKKDGTLGQMETREICDEDGLYGPYKCIPGQICYCTLSNGTRIFGEAPYSSIADYMSCDCSRKYYEAVDVLGQELGPHQHFRCTANGDYDTLQCINKKCLCVDTADGAPTYPTKSLVNMTEISKTTLPCYTLSKKGQYYKPCELEYMELLEELEELEAEGYTKVVGFDFPNCDLDGTYAPVQQNSSHKYCVSPEGKVLGDYVVAINDAADMNCKCARANLISASIEKAQCLENGNYRTVQCRRGVCRCVDSNGNQECKSDKCESDENSNPSC
ncbi:hypothetical protein GWI33_016470 [Rhynchophorus ferrugineus]|uniref:Thyroglobulin type-1 domain-containing protein n=1 Tax=Rhynchophorus ferrugineus TaxID=354439 RepID=A0A834HYP9_RHYFE|nr:hypothetical protein GWI33_016470 [Rhynchophorus ferrugineus]